MSNREIQSVTVLGAGTMGSGIAATCAEAGCKTNLLDVTPELAERGKQNMLIGRAPMLDNPESVERITTGGFDDSLALAAESDWICEAIVENLESKREIFSRLDRVRRPNSIVTSNTSGIPLRSICEGMSEQFRKDVAVTHFFNPVKVMRLLELVAGEDTTADVIGSLGAFARNSLGKGVVYAKDTVNFIGNRIGCFWMLAGFHKGRQARIDGISIEKMDSLMSAALGIPSTGLYGLIDLVGLDVMKLVATNLNENLPDNDVGRAYLEFPPEEQAMFDAGQLGRKSDGGFYRMLKNEDGTRRKEMYESESGVWLLALGASVSGNSRSVVFDSGAEGKFAWSLISETLCYAADLVPDISNDIVNVDRAMRWGFNWNKGPFELFDALGTDDVIARLRSEGRKIPRMLETLQSSGLTSFYSGDGAQYIGTDGNLHAVPQE